MKVMCTKRFVKEREWICSSNSADDNISRQNDFLDNLCASDTSFIDFDRMDGEEFERFCARLLIKNGYEDISLTKGSGNQGIDIIAYRDGIKHGIQCKCYSSDIGNSAVQEVFA